MPNMLQMQPQQQMQQGQPMQQPVPQPPPAPPTQQQVADAHTHFSYMQKMLDNLIKLPDSELNLRKIFDSSAEMVLENQLSGGKKGVSAKEVATEMSDPNFPTADSSAAQIRQFLQNYFDKSIMRQAAVTSKFGGPQQTQSPPQGTPQQ